MRKVNLHLWLIRIYAAIVVLVVFTSVLEGVGFALVVSIASVGIVIQSFFISAKLKESGSTEG